MVAVLSPMVTVPDLGIDASFGATTSLTAEFGGSPPIFMEDDATVMNGALLTIAIGEQFAVVAPAGGIE